jgi:hypothetical protein
MRFKIVFLTSSLLLVLGIGGCSCNDTGGGDPTADSSTDDGGSSLLDSSMLEAGAFDGGSFDASTFDAGDADASADAGAGDAGGPDATAFECRDALPLGCGDQLRHSTISEGQPDLWGAYSCTARGESGPETVYAFRTDERCQVTARLSELEDDIDLFVMDECDPFASLKCSSAPLDLQTQELVRFQAEAGRDYVVAVDGYSGASGSYALSVNCLCGDSAVDLADGEWLLQVNRRWNGDLTGIDSSSTPLPQEDYEPTSDGTSYVVRLARDWFEASIGDEPLLGELTTEPGDKLTYEITTGTTAGGRLVIWTDASGLQAELTIYGSGVPIVSSERGPLVPQP